LNLIKDVGTPEFFPKIDRKAAKERAESKSGALPADRKSVSGRDGSGFADRLRSEEQSEPRQASQRSVSRQPDRPAPVRTPENVLPMSQLMKIQWIIPSGIR
jgi:hypothetical protein